MKMTNTFAYLSKLFTLVKNNYKDGWQMSQGAKSNIEKDGNSGLTIILTKYKDKIIWVSDEEAEKHDLKELPRDFFDLNPKLLPERYQK